MAAPRQIPIRLILLLAVIPLGWWVLDYVKVLGVPNNIAENSMFRFRGEIPAYDSTRPDHPPLKVVYVDVDAPTVNFLGERPWSRQYYARMINTLFTEGHIKAVGFDFMLSPAGMKSELVDKKKAKDNDTILGQVLQNFPNSFTSTIYSDTEVSFDLPVQSTGNQAEAGAKNPPPNHQSRMAAFPYLYQGGHDDPANNPYPESPTFPIMGIERIRTGMIDVATQFNGDGVPDNIPRWIPLFAETKGTEHTDNFIFGLFSYYGNEIDPSFIVDQGDKVQIINPEGGNPLVLAKVQDVTFYNLSVKLALAFLGLNEKNIKRSESALDIVNDKGGPMLHIPLTERQLVEINWFSKWDNPVLNPHLSFLDVVEADSAIVSKDPAQKAAAEKIFEQLKDAIVLVGPVDPILQDIAPTPFDAHAVPKVGVYGNLLKTFFSGLYIHRAPGWIKTVLLFGLTALIGALATYGGRHSGMAKIAALVILAAYILGVYEMFAQFNWVLPLVAPVGAAFSTALVGVVVRLLEEEKQKKRIKGMFGTYISPELVHRMVESGEEPKLGGEQLTISIFFSDVQGFSGFSEVLTPEKLVELMNEYLTAMTDILQAESGTLDKYIGDAVVAMFGAPIHVNDNALRSCIAACRMQKRLAELRQKWVNEGDKWPPLVHKMRSRIGLNTGPAVVGNMGSTSRFNYTMMGDDVNLGARLESGAKQFGVYTMCSEATKLACEKIEQTVLFRRLNRIKVKGRSTPVDVHEVTCLRADASPDTLRCVQLFEEGLALYFTQQWDDAIAKFREAQILEPLQPGRDAGVEHTPSEMMLAFCAAVRQQTLPKDWDGVYELTSK